ncbi:glycosyltransferase family 4 protein [Dermatophilaceae bacterium Soc4.6]
MRILHVNKFLYRRGGAEGYMLDVAALQRSAGHEVGFWGMDHPENDRPQPLGDTFASHVELEPAPGGLAGVAAAGRMVWSRSSAAGLSAAVARFRPDIVHCHNIYHQLSPSILRPLARAGVPVVMTLHDYKLACPSYQLLADGAPCEACVGHGTWHAAVKRCKGGSLAGSVVLAVESGLHRAVGAYDSVDHFVCPSQFLAGVMQRQGISADRLSVVNNFTDIPAPRERHDAGEGIVFAGRLSHEKGVDVAIRAIARTSAGLLHIAGDGPERAALEVLAAQVAPGRVVFHGRLDAGPLAELVRSCRALTLPARWHENQPMTILEAFAVGTPVVVTDLGGLPELVTDAEHGLVVRAGDEAALAAAFDALAVDSVASLAMGRNGRARLERDFGAETHLQRLDTVYEQAAARRGSSLPPSPTKGNS